MLLGAMGALLLALLLWPSAQDDMASVMTEREEWLVSEPVEKAVDKHQTTIVLKAGDTAASALTRFGFPYAEIAKMSQAAAPIHTLRKVQIGHAFTRLDTVDSSHVYYVIDESHRLHLQNAALGGAWKAELETRPLASRQLVIEGLIEGSLFEAAGRAGLDDRATMNLVDIFGWDIDFARDMRDGDTFKVLLEEVYDAQGKYIDSNILAAEFINQGETYRAIRFEVSPGHVEYFSPDGHSMRKTYLKSPVKFSRISSRFSTSRKHPVLGYTRAHRGVDYAASSGTPIRAIGDGQVLYAGWKGGYGNFLLIRHTNAIHKTAYGHLLKFGRGIRKGVRVKQGQIVGYVGMTGLATGPHLHFEFRVHDRAVNPLSIKHDPANPVPESQMARFRAQAGKMMAQMDTGTMVAAWE